MEVVLYNRIKYKNFVSADKDQASVAIVVPDDTPLKTIKELVGAASDAAGIMLENGKGEQVSGIAAVVEL